MFVGQKVGRLKHRKLAYSGRAQCSETKSRWNEKKWVLRIAPLSVITVVRLLPPRFFGPAGGRRAHPLGSQLGCVGCSSYTTRDGKSNQSLETQRSELGTGRYIYSRSQRRYNTQSHRHPHTCTHTVVNSRSCQIGMHGWSVGGEIKSYFTACSSSRKQGRAFDLWGWWKFSGSFVT